MHSPQPLLVLAGLLLLSSFSNVSATIVVRVFEDKHLKGARRSFTFDDAGTCNPINDCFNDKASSATVNHLPDGWCVCFNDNRDCTGATKCWGTGARLRDFEDYDPIGRAADQSAEVAQFAERKGALVGSLQRSCLYAELVTLRHKFRYGGDMDKGKQRVSAQFRGLFNGTWSRLWGVYEPTLCLTYYLLRQLGEKKLMRKVILPFVQEHIIPMLRSPTVAELLKKVATELLSLPLHDRMIETRHFLKLTTKLAAAKTQVLLIAYSRADTFLEERTGENSGFHDLVKHRNADVHVAESRQHFPKEKSITLVPRTRATGHMFHLVPAIFEIAEGVDERLIIIVREAWALDLGCDEDSTQLPETPRAPLAITLRSISLNAIGTNDVGVAKSDEALGVPRLLLAPDVFPHYTKAGPVISAFFCLICGLHEEDYTYCSGQLKRHSRSNNANRVRCFVTDPERALINGLEDSTLFQRPASHVLCELHLVDNGKRSTPLRSLDKDIKTALVEIFGEERRQIAGGRYKIGGLVDSKSKEQFDLRLEALKEKWDCLAPGFFDCFEENTGAKIRANYLLPTRLAAGRNHNRVTNNDQENLNRRMKEELEGPLKPPHQLIRIVEQFFQDAFERLELAVISQGGLPAEGEVPPPPKDLGGMAAPGRKTLSIPLSAAHLPGTSPAQLQELKDTAVTLLTNDGRFHDLIDAIGTSVEDKGFVRVVKWDDSGGYRFSSCEQFKTYRFVCAHTLAVAERNNTLIAHLVSITNQFENETAELLLKRRLQPGVGKKPSRRTGHPFTATLQDRTVVEIVQRPIASTSVNMDVT
uniref:SWIM-type domain-containing protein n=1 Tax=Plectus sambesii TaxID=2011161 RepID=A0A914VZ50_9BILA